MTIILLATEEEGGRGENSVLRRSPSVFAYGTIAIIWIISAIIIIFLIIIVIIAVVTFVFNGEFLLSLSSGGSKQAISRAFCRSNQPHPPPGSKPTTARPSWYPLNNPLLPSNTPGPCWCPFENNPPRPPKRLIPLWIEKERRHFYGDHFHSHLVLKRLKNLLKPDVMMTKTRHFENLDLIEKTISGAWRIWKLSEGSLVRKTQ